MPTGRKTPTTSPSLHGRDGSSAPSGPAPVASAGDAGELVRRILRERSGGDRSAARALVAELLGPGALTQEAQRAIDIDLVPHALAMVLAACLGRARRPQEAASAYRVAADAAPPTDPSPFMHLTNALVDADDVRGAMDAAREAARRRPDDPAMFEPFIGLLNGAGLSDQAMAVARGALGLHPESAVLLRSTALVMNYWDKTDHAEAASIARRFGRVLERQAGEAPAPPASGASRHPDQRLRVGYLSPDLRAHSVAHFVQPLLEHHDRSQVDVFVYDTGSQGDGVTDYLRRFPATWRAGAGLSDNALAEQIRTDGVDVLIELSGLTNGHRLGVMARRAAPLQMTYLGYPNTTGLSRIDDRIVDVLTDPPGACDALLSERALRLPGCFVCYRPPDDAPDPGPPPCLASASAPITFGCFNKACKISGATIELWARLLHAVPGSRLLLKSVDFRGSFASGLMRERFGALGVDPARVRTIAWISSRREHLEAYREIDIALDPFPYNGTTTTCEALWMGVPVVALVGGVHASRVGLSLLTAAGQGDLAARGPGEYLRIASGLASDRAGLAARRASLRGSVRASALCDGPRFARGFEAALRARWRALCLRAA